MGESWDEAVQAVIVEYEPEPLKERLRRARPEGSQTRARPEGSQTAVDEDEVPEVAATTGPLAEITEQPPIEVPQSRGD